MHLLCFLTRCTAENVVPPQPAVEHLVAGGGEGLVPAPPARVLLAPFAAAAFADTVFLALVARWKVGVVDELFGIHLRFPSRLKGGRAEAH